MPGPLPNPGWNVVFGEQPTAAKWSELGANDDALSNGSGIQAGIILPSHLMSGAPSSWAWQAWTPTVVGFSSTSIALYYYMQIGKTVYWTVDASGTGNSTSMTISLPVNASAAHNVRYEGVSNFFTNGGTIGGPARIEIVPATAQIITFFTSFTGSGWTASGSREIHAQGFYEAA